MTSASLTAPGSRYLAAWVQPNGGGAALHLAPVDDGAPSVVVAIEGDRTSPPQTALLYAAPWWETQLVRAAPARIGSLVGAASVVGFFDGDWERRARRQLEAEGFATLDLTELAIFVLPGLSRYTRAGIGEALIPGSVANGCADATHIGAIFRALRARVEALGGRPLEQINRLSVGLGWRDRSFFLDCERSVLRRTRFDDVPHAGPADAEGVPRELVGLLAPLHDPDDGRTGSDHAPPGSLLTALEPDSDFAHRFPGFEPRREQQEMAAAVSKALLEGEQLLVEAGTGTGKSLAYLLPALHVAQQRRKPVVISTYTINLQDQLFRKDIPQLRRCTEAPFRASLLKGRENYLCLSRWLALLRAAPEDLTEDERYLLIKTLLWLPRTESGDVGELHLSSGERLAWGRLAARTDWCTPGRCRYHRAGICFLARARARGEESDVVVVNHALLLTDARSSPRLLPEYEYLVVDEAHHLEEVATAQLSRSLRLQEILASVESLRRGVAASDHSQNAGEGGSPVAELSDEARESLEALALQAGECVPGLVGLFSALASFAHSLGQAADAGGAQLRIAERTRAQPDWSTCEIAWDDARPAVGRLVSRLKETSDLLDAISVSSEAADRLADQIDEQRERWADWRRLLDEAILEPAPDTVYWITSGRQNESLQLSAAPLDIAPLLKERLFDPRRAVVCTSATLTTDGSFAFLKRRLGLEGARELRVGSPFDYRHSALLYVPDDLPDPTRSGYQSALEDMIVSVAAALGGRTLVLLTSHAHLRRTHSAVRSRLAEAGVRALAQGADGATRPQLLEAFRDAGRSVLLGTSSFWEGVDVVGPALSCLIIVRLPFSVPTDPIFQARSEQFESPFGQYALPQAILRLKQGFGRLIRSRDDRGVAIIADSRIRARSYGRSFLRSLPACTVRVGPSEEAAASARAFLEPAEQDRAQADVRRAPLATNASLF